MRKEITVELVDQKHIFVHEVENDLFNQRLAIVPGAKYERRGASRTPGWKVSLSRNSLDELKDIADEFEFRFPMYSPAKRMVVLGEKVLKDRRAANTAEMDIPTVEEISESVTRDNIGFAKFLNEIYGFEIGGNEVSAVFRLARFWTVSDQRKELIESIAKEIEATASEIKTLSIEEPENVGNIKENIGGREAQLIQLTAQLGRLSREVKLMTSLTDNEIRRRASWRKVM